MNFKHFFYTFRDINGVQLSEDVFLFRKPLEIWNAKTDKTVRFDNLKDVWQYEFSPGVTVGDALSKVDDFTFELTGGHGKGSGANGTFKFGHASDRGGGKEDNAEPLHPVQANVRIKSKTPEGALKEFRERHVSSDREWMYEVDDRGYVQQYARGNATSVAPTKTVKKNSMIYHNHPGKKGGAFSDNDLLFVAQTKASGIVASGREGDYILTKRGGHFKSNEFTKAVKRAKMKGKDYDDAVRKWLGDKDRQKKLGYKFEFKPARGKKRS